MLVWPGEMIYLHVITDGFGDVRVLNQEAGDWKDLSIEGKVPIKINTCLIQRHIDEREKISYWENRWASANSPWHKKDINPFLCKYFQNLQVNVKPAK